MRRWNSDVPPLIRPADPLESSSRGLFSVETAEADAFFCFTAIMSHMRDRFIKALDLSPTGVLNTIAHVNQLLQRVDHQLWAHLQSIGVDPRFYSFRWLTLILSQEFELPDVLRLWDSLFAAEPEASVESTDVTAASSAAAASQKRKGTAGDAATAAGSSSASPTGTAAEDGTNKKLIVEFLNDCCCAILCLIRRTLLEADFGQALKALQSAGAGLDVQRVLFKAQEIGHLRRANGGFVAAAAAAKPPPPPLTKQDLSVSFNAMQPRPHGDEGESGTTNKSAASRFSKNIALLDAVKDPEAAARASAAGAVRQQQQQQQTPSVASSAVSAAAALGSSVSSLVHSVAESAVMASVVGEVGALVAAAGRAGEAGLHAVETAIEKAADAATGTPKAAPVAGETTAQEASDAAAAGTVAAAAEART